MAVLSTCAKLANGFDAACEAPVRKYFQQAVLINKDDIDLTTVSITQPDDGAGACRQRVEFSLKSGSNLVGFRFIGPEAGSSFFGTFDKSRADIGHAQYVHNAQVLVVGNDENSKCILNSLDKGTFVVAMQTTDGQVEIFGIRNGLSTGDYTYDLQAGGGGTPILLSSLEDAPEPFVPLVYVSGTPGNEGIDFDAAFLQP